LAVFLFDAVSKQYKATLHQVALFVVYFKYCRIMISFRMWRLRIFLHNFHYFPQFFRSYTCE